jgi:hypothetical protein
LTAETVVVALEDIEDYHAFEAAIIAAYDAELPWTASLLRLAALLWRIRRATAIETDLLQIQAENLHDRRFIRRRLSCFQRAVLPSLRRQSGNGSRHDDQSDSI